MLPQPLAVTLLVTDALEALGISYIVGGSLASAIHGTTRSTLDTDIVAVLNDTHIEPLVRLLQPAFFVDPEVIRAAIATHDSFNLFHTESMFKVDIFIARPRQFDAVQLQRRQLQQISDNPARSVYVSTAEDIILAKLEWFRLGDEISDRQWRDILGVLHTQAGRLDIDYLQKWASELGVADLLKRALSEAAR